MKRLLLLLFILYSFVANSQPCIPVYKNVYGGSGSDEALTIFYTSDRGSIVAGRTTSNSAGSYDAFMMKLSPTGTITWSKTFGGSNYDQITKIKQSADGGYIAIGSTYSFGNTAGEPFILKTDGAGNIQWANKYIQITSAQHETKDLIQLSDGSYAVLFNLNDSTTQANAVVARLAANGSILWHKEFDNDDDDGFNSLAEDGDSLVVGGHSVRQFGSQGVLMKLNKATGNPFWTKTIRRYSREPTVLYVTDILMVDRIVDGVAFSSNSSYAPWVGYRELTNFRMKNDGTIPFQRSLGPSTSSGLKLESVTVLTTADSGFMNIVNDTTPWGYPEFNQMGPTGHIENGRILYNDYEFTRMPGMHIAGTEGFLFAGFYKPMSGMQFNKIRIVKTDAIALSGACSWPTQYAFLDTVYHSILPITWKSISSPAHIAVQSISFSQSTDIFTLLTQCQDTYCAPQPVFTDTCNATFALKLGGDGSVEVYDAVRANDGGFLVTGSYNYTPEIEPFLAKLRPNGSVAWSKSFASYLHSGNFKKIVPLSDGNYLIHGYDHILLNHNAFQHVVLVKIDVNGNIIWSKIMDDGLRTEECIPTENGGVIISLYKFSSSPMVMRIDGNGNFVWKKQGLFLSTPGPYSQLLLDGQDLYLTSDEDKRFRFEKWNALTGQPFWQQRYEMPGTKRIVAAGLLKSGDTVNCFFISYKEVSMFNTLFNTTVVRYLSDGTLIGGYNITPGEAYDAVRFMNDNSRALTFMKTSDGNFMRAIIMRSNDSVYLAAQKFTPSGQKIFSKKYPHFNSHQAWKINPDGDNAIISGLIYLPAGFDRRRYKSFILNIDSRGLIKENAIGECLAEEAPFVKEPMETVQTTFNGAAGVKDDTIVQLLNYVYTMRTNKVVSELNCNTPATCNLIAVNGEDTICSITGIYRFDIQRNAGCTSPSTWLVQSPDIRIVSSTDSTIFVQFLKPGEYNISARLTAGCSMLTGEKKVVVYPAAADLKLGNDTSLCDGNTILLRAGKDFATYEWQDGSRDSTFTVSVPGTYYVRVTDRCGSPYTDTIRVLSAPAVPLYAGADRVKCNSDTVHLNAPTGFLNYTWTDISGNETTGRQIVVNPNADAPYFLRAEKTPGCFGFDTVSVKVNHSPGINLGTDTNLCASQTLLLTAPLSFGSYQWSNGSTSQSITVGTSGQYHVRATDNNGCSSYDTIRILAIHALPVVALNDNPLLCEGTTRNLQAGNHTRYTWSNGSTAPSITIADTGTYAVRVWNQFNCESGDTIRISAISPSPTKFLRKDSAICQYSSIDIQPIQKYQSYLWSNNSVVSSMKVNQAGTYWLEVTDAKGCKGRDSIVVSIKDCIAGFFIPNAFTPDGNGRNDLFRPLIYGHVEKYQFEIYNRWGQLIFHSQTLGEGWDGTLRGLKQSNGTFVWKVTYQLEGHAAEAKSGTVQLVR